MLNKSNKFIVVSFFVLMIAGGVISLISNSNAVDTFTQLEFNGIINGRIYLKNKKALFVLIDTTWYGTMHYPLERYLEKGDSVFKKNHSNCIKVKRSGVDFEDFCSSYAYKVHDHRLIKNLSSSLEKNKGQPFRE